MNSIYQISKILTNKEKQNAFILLFLMFIMAIVDSLGVVSIMPFMKIISNQNIIDSNIYLNFVYKNLRFHNKKSFIYFLGISIFLFMIFSMIFKSITTYYQLRFTLMREFAIGERLLKTYFNQPYEWFLNKNSSVLGKNILSEIEKVINGSFMPLLNIISNSFISLLILTMLFIINFKLAITIGSIFFIVYLVIFKFFRNFLAKMSNDNLIANALRFKIINEAFGGIKEVKVFNVENIFLEKYKIPAITYAKNLSLTQIIGQLPRYIIETIAFGGIIILILYLMFIGGYEITNIIPLLSLYVFAGYKLMPALQQIYNNTIYFKFAKSALNNLYYEIVNYKNNSNFEVISNNIIFENTIELKNITYYYPDTKKAAIDKLNLKINSKTTIGIVGHTGSGKTTLIDLLLGLLLPSEGSFIVDDKLLIEKSNLNNWRKSIGYVPQSIFLIDDTIEANIAFGIPRNLINKSAVENAAKIANLLDFINNDLPDKFQTKVGERGIMLSGGQRQRIGIARALYYSPSLLILDEATSALDNITEREVMNAISTIAKSITIIIIAHRLTTIKKCDQIYLLEKGKIINNGSFDELIKDSVLFRKMAILDNE